MRTQVKVSADSAGTLQLELVLELFDASAELVDLLDGDLRTQTAYVYMYLTSHMVRHVISSEHDQQMILQQQAFGRTSVNFFLTRVRPASMFLDLSTRSSHI